MKSALMSGVVYFESGAWAARSLLPRSPVSNHSDLNDLLEIEVGYRGAGEHRPLPLVERGALRLKLGVG